MALAHRIEAPGLWRIVRATARSIARNRGVRIVADRPFPSRARPSPDALRREVAAGVRREGAVYLIGLRGGHDHWTVVRRATSRDLYLYAELGFEGRSSHSGRRSFITTAARDVAKAGCSLRDVQMLAGHRSIETIQRYIDGDTDARRRLVGLI